MNNKITTFAVEEKVLANGDKAYILIDDKGYTCGLFATIAHAEKAAPAIARNINQGYVPRSVLHRNPNSDGKRFRQVSRKK